MHGRFKYSREKAFEKIGGVYEDELLYEESSSDEDEKAEQDEGEDATETATGDPSEPQEKINLEKKDKILEVHEVDNRADMVKFDAHLAALELVGAKGALRFFSYSFVALKNLRRVQDLSLRGCTWIEKEDLMRILGGVRAISYLDLSFIPAVDDEVCFMLGE